MRFSCPVFLFCFLGSIGAMPAQTGTVLKFDEGCGTDTLAYPVGTTAAAALPRQIYSNQAALWAPGRWGSALRGCDDPTVVGARGTVNYLRAGIPSGSGDLTMAFWMKERVGVARRQQLLLGGPYIQLLADRPSGALEMVFQQPSVAILTSQANVFSLAAVQWVHVAVVYDEASLKLTLYIDGNAEATASVASPVVFPGSWDVGHRGGTLGTCHYDIDEFFIDRRVSTAAEVTQLRSSSVAAVGDFGGGCSFPLNAMSLQWLGGAPAPGVAGTLRATKKGTGANLLPGSAAAISFGDNRCSWLTNKLPFDISTIVSTLPRCTLMHSQNLLIATAVIGASGNYDIPLTIPANVPALALYAQAYVIEPGGTLRVSNGLALAIGN